jgi:hypothetical protein
MIKTKIIIRNSVIGVCILIGLQSTAVAEYRCGWLDNPEAGSFQLIDKEAVWSISNNSGYRIPAASLKNLPERQEDQFIRTSGNFGYSCSCISVKTESRSRRITAISFKGKQVLLKRCLEDKTIAHRQPSIKRQMSGVAINQPSGSYTDTPVISGTESTGASQYSNGTVKEKTGKHYIQVMVTSISSKAKSMKKSFDKAGFKTVISAIRSKGKVLHKVSIGPFPNRRSAVNNRTKLQKQFKETLGVKKSIIVG